VTPRDRNWWDRWFLGLAEYTATASKDPSTKVGAAIVRPDKTIASLGYNGFPRGIADTEERLQDRETKYGLVVHGELNAILTAREPLHGYTLYTWPLFTCSNCAKLVIQSGITRVVAPVNDNERWKDSLALSQSMYQEAGVLFDLVKVPHAA
jgi:dCMP deaminase